MLVKQGFGYLLSCAVATGLLAVDFRILTSSDVAAPKVRHYLQDQLGGSVEIGEVDLLDVGVFRCRNVRIQPPPLYGKDDEIRCDSIQVEYRGVPLPGLLKATRVSLYGL